MEFPALTFAEGFGRGGDLVGGDGWCGESDEGFPVALGQGPCGVALHHGQHSMARRRAVCPQMM